MSKNSYVLGKRIARGGMAEIYLGKAVGEAAFQKIVAIKRILPHYAGDKEFIEMFRDEAHICKRLQHNNIVQVYDFAEVDGSYALVMEHVDGADLRSLLSACEAAKTRLSVPMALYICASAARALHYAHTKTDEITNEALGIVHRDISPQNILISYEGDVKITDFGIASAENKLTETRPGVVKGKYSYMSPEQVSAKPLDGRSDVFSLGIVLWEILAMKRLFAGTTEVESIRRVQNCEIPHDVSELNPEVDAELRQIVLKGLSKDRRQRYQTAAAFEKDLLRYLHSRYSDFTSRELGNFLKRILAKKRDKTQDDIKETLAQEAVSPKLTLTSTPISAGEPLVSRAQAMTAPTTSSDNLAWQASQNDALSLGKRPIELQLSSTGEERNLSLANGPRRSHQPRPIGTEIGSREKGFTNSSRPKPYPLPQIARRQSPSKKLPALLLVIGMMAGGFYFAKQQGWIEKLQSNSMLQIELSTSPEIVSIKVRGTSLKGDLYKRTPLKLSLVPGIHELEISHPGYQKQTIRVAGNEGEYLRPDKIFLKRLANSEFASVRIDAVEGTINVDVDNGLYRGPTPLKVNVLAGVQHALNFRSSTDQNPFRCTFIIERGADLSKSRVLKISPQKGQKMRCQLLMP